MKDFLVTHQQGELRLVEPMEPRHPDRLFITRFVKQRSEHPKAVLFFASTCHQDEASDEVQRLAVADVWVVHSVRLQDVAQDFLSG